MKYKIITDEGIFFTDDINHAHELAVAFNNNKDDVKYTVQVMESIDELYDTLLQK